MTNSSRAQLAAAGRALRAALELPADIHGDAAPGLGGLYDELVFGALWTRPGLEPSERMVAVLASLAALERRPMLAAYATAAATLGVDARAVREIVLQAGLYTGFVAGEENLAAVNEVLGEPEEGDGGVAADADLGRMGVTLMETVHGARARAGYASGQGAPAALYELAIAYGYGLLWNRPGLARRQRFITTVSVFATLEQHVQLAKFARSAIDNGLAYPSVIEVVMQVAPYCGFPRALNGLSALERELGETTTL